VKFDTTALALAMSMLLMFIHFFVERTENSLLDEVDSRVMGELKERFPATPAGADGQVLVMRQMVEVMVQSVQRLVERQMDEWHTAMDAAATRWARIADTVGLQVKASVVDGLAESLKRHADRLTNVEETTAAENRQSMEKVEESLCRAAEALEAIQTNQTHQAETLGHAIEATGEVARLQDLLNRNLAALGGAKHIEQSVLGLAAAIHMMNARLAESPVEPPVVPRDPPRKASHAA
jgi:hypothetical protein